MDKLCSTDSCCCASRGVECWRLLATAHALVVGNASNRRSMGGISTPPSSGDDDDAHRARRDERRSDAECKGSVCALCRRAAGFAAPRVMCHEPSYQDCRDASLRARLGPRSVPAPASASMQRSSRKLLCARALLFDDDATSHPTFRIQSTPNKTRPGATASAARRQPFVPSPLPQRRPPMSL